MFDPQNSTIAQLAIKHPDVAFQGQLRYGNEDSFVRSIRNGSGNVVPKKTLGFTGAFAADTDYAFQLQDQSFKVSSTGTADNAELAEKIATTINRNPNITIGFAVVVGGEVVVTSDFLTDFIFTTTDTKLSVTVNDALSNGAAIGYGLAIIKKGKDGYLPGNAELSKRRIDLTGISAATTLQLLIAGKLINATGTDAATLQADLIANLTTVSLESLLSFNQPDANTLEIEAATAGQHFEVINVTGAGVPSIAVIGDNIDLRLAGFTYCEDFTQGQQVFESGDMMNVWSRGEGLTVAVTNPSEADALFIGEDGVVYNSAAAGRVSTSRLAVMETLAKKWAILSLSDR